MLAPTTIGVLEKTAGINFDKWPDNYDFAVINFRKDRESKSYHLQNFLSIQYSLKIPKKEGGLKIGV